MARKSKDAELESRLEAEALNHFQHALGELPDPRRRQGQRYSLKVVVVTALMAMVCGADDAEAMQDWSEANSEWLAELFDLPHGVPTQDVYLAVFAALDPAAFGEIFRTWVALLQTRLQAQEGIEGHVAVDGKTSRRSHDAANGAPAIHTVSAWLAGAGLVLGQVDTGPKTNEMKTIPKLLRLLDLRLTTVTVDAGGCYTEIAEATLERGGNYLIAVKDNQPTLKLQIIASFRDALNQTRRPLDQSPPLAFESHAETSKGHGRLEERTLYLIRNLTWVTESSRWAGLALIAMSVARRTDLTTGVTTEESRYFIGSHPTASASTIAGQVRSHWEVENSLHWVLDMAFNEDQARHRAGNCAKNMTILRHVALNLLKSDKSKKLGVANKRKAAGWDRGYLLRVLAGPRV
jgi:predicted transposase YbfD/YdcC